MIRTFAGTHRARLYLDGTSRRLPADVLPKARRKLAYVDAASRVDDLRVPPGNLLHRLSGDRAGQHAIYVNDQWQICFRFSAGDAYDVEITDYH